MGNWITPLSADVNNNDVAWSVLVGGVAFTIVFAMIGNKILKDWCKENGYDLYNSECYWSRFF